MRTPCNLNMFYLSAIGVDGCISVASGLFVAHNEFFKRQDILLIVSTPGQYMLDLSPVG